MEFERSSDLNLEATELRLGLPGTVKTEKLSSTRKHKRSFPDINDGEGDDRPSGSSRITFNSLDSTKPDEEIAPHTKIQVVGWPPIRSYRKNCLQAKKPEPEVAGIYVKVSMDGAPYLRKIDLNVYKGYPKLLKALEEMFKFQIGEYSEKEGYNGSEFVPTYEDKDGDWMLVGDVPWEMFINSCKRLRVMKGFEGTGLGCVL